MGYDAITPNQFIKQLYLWEKSPCFEGIELVDQTREMCNSCPLNDECDNLADIIYRLRERESEV